MVRFSGGLALFFVLLLTLSTVTPALADTQIVNGSFDAKDNPGAAQCSLKGWSHQGQVQLVNGMTEGLYNPDNCIAKLTAREKGSATLSQTFEVPDTNNFIYVYLWARRGQAQSPKLEQPSQIVRLTVDGKIIVEEGRAMDRWNTGVSYFKYDLHEFAGRQVTLEVQVTVDKHNPASPDWSTLYVDRLELGPDGGERGTGQGTYSW